MTHPGRGELSPEELDTLLGGELPYPVRELIVWQPWPRELARDWLGFEPSQLGEIE